MDDLKAKQQLYNGFGDTMARGIELAITPVIFGALGFLLDSIFGIRPVLTIVFVLFAVAGLSVKMYYSYAAAMAAHEAESVWRKR